jgi:hypothetical protein
MPVFDAEELTRRLVAAGMPEGQARVLAHEFVFNLNQLATKEDVHTFVMTLDAKLERLRVEFQRDQAEREKRMLKTMGVMFATSTTLLFAALSLVIAYAR